jgi:hypothetical protein
MKNNKKFSFIALLFLTLVIVIFGYLLTNNDPIEQSKNPTGIVVSVEADTNIPSTGISAKSERSAYSHYGSLYLIIGILAIGFSLSVSITFYLYRWRKILLSNPNTVVPEEWAKFLQDVGKKLHFLSGTVENNLKRVVSTSLDQTSKISNMTNTYMELQNALYEKDQEISRLKKGYDAEIFRRFIVRFARIEQSLDDFLIDNDESEEYSQLKRLFEDAFEECGVTRSSLSVGDDYRTAIGVSDNPKTENTDDPKLEFKISEIIESGYELNTGIGDRTIIPSKVRIYKIT